MKKSNVIELSSREENADPLAELIRQGARQLDRASHRSGTRRFHGSLERTAANQYYLLSD